MLIRLAIPFVVLSLAAAAPAMAQVPGDPVRGKAVAERWCVECHVISAESQTGSDVAPSFTELGANPEKTESALRGFLTQPHEPMPPLEIPAQAIEDLIAYIGTLGLSR